MLIFVLILLIVALVFNDPDIIMPVFVEDFEHIDPFRQGRKVDVDIPGIIQGACEGHLAED